MTKHKSQPKAKLLPRIKIATSSFSLEDEEDEEKSASSSAKRRKKLLSISEEHSDGEATPRSKPLDGFGDTDSQKTRNKRRGSVQKTQTMLMDKTSNGAFSPTTFDVKIDVRPILKGPDNKVTPIEFAPEIKSDNM